MGRIIALATPVFFALIAVEYLVGRVRGRSNYRLNDAVNSLSLGIMSQVLGLFTRALTIGIYASVYAAVSIRQLPADQWWVWVLGIVSYDFCYYWFHRVGHESAVFWASHVVHHQSQEYNLTTALRQTSSSALLGWIFYLPMAIAGIPPEVFAVTAIVNLLYQYWIHTEQVDKLGWFDRWFSSPSNHRVHHAVNDRYIDRNYGGIFMIWDRMFGSFVEETERCVYGTRSPLDSWDPLWANLEVYADLAQKSWHAGHWRDRLLVWIMPPGWQPALASGAHWEKPHFDVTQLRRYDPPIDRGARWFSGSQFVAVLLGTAPLLWFASSMPFAELAAWSTAAIALLWITGAVMQGRLRVPTALAIEAAAAVLLAVSLQATAEPAPMPVIVDPDNAATYVIEDADAGSRTVKPGSTKPPAQPDTHGHRVGGHQRIPAAQELRISSEVDPAQVGRHCETLRHLPLGAEFGRCPERTASTVIGAQRLAVADVCQVLGAVDPGACIRKHGAERGDRHSQSEKFRAVDAMALEHELNLVGRMASVVHKRA